jgi:DNA-binding NtrC family response regulator
MNHPWRGNVRELRNLIERIVVLKDGDTLQLEDLPEKVRLGEPSAGRGKERAAAEEGISFQTAVSEFEKALILSALEKTNWVKNRAADLLKIKRTTLVEKIKRYNLEKSGGDS